MRQSILILLLFAVFPLSLSARTEVKRDNFHSGNETRYEAGNGTRHEVRVGWGDMLYESAVFFNSSEKRDYRYTGHIFGEYQYRFNNWLSAGLQLDWEKVGWNRNEYFTNFCILPDIRFTYFRKNRFTIYSGLSLGLCVNGGTEVNYKGHRTECAPALGLTLVGGTFSLSNWFCALELGGLNALNGKNEVYLAASRIFSISIGYRF